MENIKIYLRIRPFTPKEEPLGNLADNSRNASPLSILPPAPDEHATTVLVAAYSAGSGGKANEAFVYDHVGGSETSQQNVFECVAQPVIENCLLGYNATIFA